MVFMPLAFGHDRLIGAADRAPITGRAVLTADANVRLWVAGEANCLEIKLLRALEGVFEAILKINSVLRIATKVLEN